MPMPCGLDRKSIRAAIQKAKGMSSVFTFQPLAHNARSFCCVSMHSVDRGNRNKIGRVVRLFRANGTISSSSWVYGMHTYTTSNTTHQCATSVSSAASAWVCPECKKRFLSARTLERHRSTRHAVQQAEEEEGVHNAIRESNAELEKYAKALSHLLTEMRQKALCLETRGSGVLETQKKRTPHTGSFSSNVGEECYSAVNQASPQTVPASLVKEWSRRRSSAELLYSSHRLCKSEKSNDTHARRNSDDMKDCTTLGTGLSNWMAIGKVHGSVKWGYLSGHVRQVKDELQRRSSNKESEDHALSKGDGTPVLPTPEPGSPVVAEFTLETHGYLERAPGQMMLHRNRIPVRIIGLQFPEYLTKHAGIDCLDEPCASCSISPLCNVMEELRPGDVVRVRGQYGLHASFDIVSKRLIENVVVEADSVDILQKASISAERKDILGAKKNDGVPKEKSDIHRDSPSRKYPDSTEMGRSVQEGPESTLHRESLKKKIQSRLALTSSHNLQRLRKRRKINK